jgi:hypothetical protein
MARSNEKPLSEPRFGGGAFVASVVACAALLAACEGSVGDAKPGFIPPTPPGSSTARCDGVSEPGPSPIRRMTRFEYDNTVRDLLGDATQPAQQFAPEEQAYGFDNNATALVVSSLLGEQYLAAAEKLAAAADVARLAACDPAGAGGEPACATAFVTTFGKKAYRRPLDADQIASLVQVFTEGRASASYDVAIRMTLEAILQSPYFLYRVELGAPPAAGGAGATSVPLTSWEMASRLSYFLWGTMPDAALFAAAEQGELATPEQVEAQARRLLQDPRAHAVVADFHDQLFDLATLDTLSKAAPEYTDTIRRDMKTETRLFVDDVFWNDGRFDTLFTAPWTYVSQPLANFYGIQGAPASGFAKVAVDPTQRAGVLTQGSFLAIHSRPDQSSPIHRGKFVREKLLCQAIPPPPNNVALNAPAVDPNSSTRQRFEQHEKDPQCAGCHHLMDPIGFGFEHFDPVGRWRDVDGKTPVDASGQILDSYDVNGKFDGALELEERLRRSGQVRDCVVTQWFRYGYGRSETTFDQCTLAALGGAFAKARYDLRELLVALTQTPAFRFRRVDGGSL